MPIRSAVTAFAPQLKLHLDKMTAFENGAEWHPPPSAPHLLTTLNHYPLNLKRSGTIIPVGAGPFVATPGGWVVAHIVRGGRAAVITPRRPISRVSGSQLRGVAVHAAAPGVQFPPDRRARSLARGRVGD